MANRYYNGPDGQISPFTRARAEAVSQQFQAIAEGFDLVGTLFHQRYDAIATQGQSRIPATGPLTDNDGRVFETGLPFVILQINSADIGQDDFLFLDAESIHIELVGGVLNEGDQITVYSLPVESIEGGSYPIAVKTLAELKARPEESEAVIYDGVSFAWTPGDYTGQADDVNVVQANGIPLSTGAWVRQGADKVRVTDGGSLQDAVAITKTASDLLSFSKPVNVGVSVRTADGFDYEVVDEAADGPVIETSGGARLRLKQLTSGGFSAVAFGIRPGNPSFATQNTARWNALSALNVPIIFPSGEFWINGSVTGGEAGWFGQGQGALYDTENDPQGTFIRCLGDNGGEPFLQPPDDFSGFQVTGDNQQGVGIALGVDGFFRAFKRWKDLTVRYFEDGIKTYNFYSCSWSNIVVQANKRGIDMSPAASGGDDGYWTATDWTNVHIADNTEFGLRTKPPQGTRTWTWNNVVIERNGTEGGIAQWIASNISLSGTGVYIEGAPGVPGLLLQGSASLRGDDWFFNGTGGIDTNMQPLTMNIAGLNMAGAGDTIDNISSLSSFSLSYSNIQTDLRTSPAISDLMVVTMAGGDTIRRRVKAFSVGQSVATDAEFQPRHISFTYFAKKNFTGTVPANGTATVVGEQYFPAIAADAVAIGKLPTTNPWLDVKIVTVGSGVDYYAVIIRNTSNSDVTLTDVPVTVMILRTNDPFVVP